MKLIYILLVCFLFSGIYSTAQTKVITGRVKDQNGHSIKGASVRTPDFNLGVETDSAGQFTLAVPDKEKMIIVSYVGYGQKEIQILANQHNYIITLKVKEPNDLNDVIVVGYGVQRKGDLTGAIASVDAKSMTGRMVSIEQGLQGRVAGVQITQSEASPDGGISVLIRGSNSLIGGTEPLYVIDGVPISGGNTMVKGPTDKFGPTGDEQTMTQPANMLSFLNPSDIESIEVLKDASATAIYGSRAANGVVLITTKRGEEGRTRITFNNSVDVANVYRKWDLLNAAEYADLQNKQYLIDAILRDGKTYAEAITEMPYNGTYSGQFEYNWTPDDNAGGDAAYRPTPEDFSTGVAPSTDWQQAVLRTGINQKYSIAASGGNRQVKYYFGAGIDNIQGVIVGSDFKRYTVNANIDAKLLKNVSISNSFNASNTVSNRTQVGNVQSGDSRGVMMAAVTYAPTELISTNRYQIENGLLTNSDDPYTAATAIIDLNTVYSVLDNAALTVDVYKGLQVKISGGFRYDNNARDIYYPRTSNRYWDAAGQGYALNGNDIEKYLLNENMIFYKTRFGKSRLDVTAGFTQENFTGNDHTQSGKGFLNDYNTYHILGAATTFYPPTASSYESSSMSWLGRVNYNYDDRYLFTATFRTDGSSKFGENNKWGKFPAGAFAWRINNEKFMKGMPYVSNLKLRLTAGITGNQGISPYQSESALLPGTYPVNGQLGNTYQLGENMANPDLKWEKTVQYDAGIDLGLFKDRVTFTADVYRKNTTDLLQQMALPSNTGFSSVLQNIGALTNTGLELSLTGVISNKAFHWTMSGNWSTNKIKVTSLGEGINSYPGSYVWGWSNYPFPITVGHPLGEIWGYRITNVMKTWQQQLDAANDNPNRVDATDPKTGETVNVGAFGEYDFAKDADGNMKKEILGNTNPKFIFGLNSMMSYKNFELSFAMAGAIGQDILNIQAMPGFDYTYRVHQYEDDRWIPDVIDKDGVVVFKDNGKNGNILENPYGSNYGEATYSSEVENGSWIKMKNITIGYNYAFKHSIIKTLKPYFILNNLFSIDSYSGMDPEASIYGQDPTRRGVAFSEYPMTFSMTFGVNMTF